MFNVLHILSARIAGPRSSTHSDHSYRWSQRVIRAYGFISIAALALILVLAESTGLLGHRAASQATRERLSAMQAIHGSVLSKSDRTKFELVRSMLDEKLGYLGDDTRARLAEIIYVKSRLSGVDPLLTLAVIRQESYWDTHAESFVGALGLMQVRPFVGKAVAERIGVEWDGPQTLTDPIKNVKIGIAYLSEMKQLYQRNDLALAAYNLGPYRLKGILANGVSVPENYRTRVMDFYKYYQRNYLAALSKAQPAEDGSLAMADALTVQ